MLIGANNQGIIKVLEIHFDLIYDHNVTFHTHTLLGVLIGANSQGIIKVLEIRFDLHNVIAMEVLNKICSHANGGRSSPPSI